MILYGLSQKYPQNPSGRVNLPTESVLDRQTVIEVRDAMRKLFPDADVQAHEMRFDNRVL